MVSGANANSDVVELALDPQGGHQEIEHQHLEVVQISFEHFCC